MHRERLSERAFEFAKTVYSKKTRLPTEDDPSYANSTAPRSSSRSGSATRRRPPSAASQQGAGGSSTRTVSAPRGGGLSAVRSRPTSAAYVGVGYPGFMPGGGSGSGGYGSFGSGLLVGAPPFMGAALPPVIPADVAAAYFWPGMYGGYGLPSQPGAIHAQVPPTLPLPTGPQPGAEPGGGAKVPIFSPSRPPQPPSSSSSQLSGEVVMELGPVGEQGVVEGEEVVEEGGAAQPESVDAPAVIEEESLAAQRQEQEQEQQPQPPLSSRSPNALLPPGFSPPPPSPYLPTTTTTTPSSPRFTMPTPSTSAPKSPHSVARRPELDSPHLPPSSSSSSSMTSPHSLRVPTPGSTGGGGSKRKNTIYSGTPGTPRRSTTPSSSSSSITVAPMSSTIQGGSSSSSASASDASTSAATFATLSKSISEAIAAGLEAGSIVLGAPGLLNIQISFSKAPLAAAAEAASASKGTLTLGGGSGGGGLTSPRPPTQTTTATISTITSPPTTIFMDGEPTTTTTGSEAAGAAAEGAVGGVDESTTEENAGGGDGGAHSPRSPTLSPPSPSSSISPRKLASGGKSPSHNRHTSPSPSSSSLRSNLRPSSPPSQKGGSPKASAAASPPSAAATATSPPPPPTPPPTLPTVAAVADWEARQSQMELWTTAAATTGGKGGSKAGSTTTITIPGTPPPYGHVYPVWFLLALIRAACEEIEVASPTATSAAAAAAGGAGRHASPPPMTTAGADAGGGGAFPPPPPDFVSPVRAALSPGAPLPSMSSWKVYHSASLPSAWLWLLQAARDLRLSALEASAWVAGKGGAVTAAAAEGGDTPHHPNPLLSPTFPLTLDAEAGAAAVAEAHASGAPFGGLVQEDHILRLLRRLPTGHLSPGSAIAAKTLLVRALLGVAGWGSLNSATVTIMQQHIEEMDGEPAVAAAAAVRRGSAFNMQGGLLGEAGAGAGAGTAAPGSVLEGEGGGAGNSSSSSSSTTYATLSVVGGGGGEGGGGGAGAGAGSETAEALRAAHRENFFDIVEAALLEPLTIPPPATLSSFSQYGFDALGGALGGTGVGHESAYLITPDVARDAMRAAAEGGKGGVAGPGARASFLVSPSADLYPYESGPFSPHPQLLFSPGGGAGGGAGGESTTSSTSTSTSSFPLLRPGHYSFFGPAAWGCLAYARKRTPGHANLATVLATPPEVLKKHYEFVAGCLKDVVAYEVGGFSSNSSASSSSSSPPPPPPAAAVAAVGAEVSNVVGRSLLRDAATRLAKEAALVAKEKGEEGRAGGGGGQGGGLDSLDEGVRFMLIMLTPDGKSLMEEADTGAPLLLRSVAPMLDVELALGALSRAGRRHLGPVIAAAVQAENTHQDVVSGIVANLALSPYKQKGGAGV